ncbi:MAG: hypothetical protein K6L60_00295 [Oceanobacter sp.]
MPKDYNFIYEQLVDSEDDIHGIIAYSVYKRQKIQYIKDFYQQHGVSPTEDDLLSFKEISTSPSQLEFYRSEATVLTERFLRDVLEEDLKEREKFFSAKVHSELQNIKPSHGLDILKGAAGSLLFVLLTGVLYFAVWSLSASPKLVLEEIFDVSIIPKETSDSKPPVNMDQ